MQKALTEMNVRLDSVISDIMGKTGEAILRAIVSGERDCHRLASLRNGRIRASVETIATSLEGTWREEHVLPWSRRCIAMTFSPPSSMHARGGSQRRSTA